MRRMWEKKGVTIFVQNSESVVNFAQDSVGMASFAKMKIQNLSLPTLQIVVTEWSLTI